MSVADRDFDGGALGVGHEVVKRILLSTGLEVEGVGFGGELERVKVCIGSERA